MKTNNTHTALPTVEGIILNGDDMNWIVDCPKCETAIEYQGFFDSTEVNVCKCGAKFLTTEIN